MYKNTIHYSYFLTFNHKIVLLCPLSCRRFVLNETLFSELVEASRDLPGNRWAVGGNAPVMAGRMATEGCDVLLGGSFSPDFTDVLSQHITGIQTHQRLKISSCIS